MLEIKAKLDITLDNGETYTLTFDHVDGAQLADYYLIEHSEGYFHNYQEGDITTLEGILDILEHHEVVVEDVS